MNNSMQHAIFLDRDGVIVEDQRTLGRFLHKPEHVKILPRVPEAIKLIHSMGFLAIVVTNQGGVAYGHLTEQDLDNIHARMSYLLYCEGAQQDALYAAIAYDQYRKPKPGMLLKAAEEHNLDLKRCYMIGDQETDIQAGNAVGATGIAVNPLTDTRTWKELPDYCCGDLLGAVQWIEEQEKL